MCPCTTIKNKFLEYRFITQILISIAKMVHHSNQILPHGKAKRGRERAWPSVQGHHLKVANLVSTPVGGANSQTTPGGTRD
jgi:hypothetical protein